MKTASRLLLTVSATLLPLLAVADESSETSASAASSSSSSVYLRFPIYGKTPEFESATLPSELASSCLSNPNKDLCIPDTLKQLQRAKVNFVNQQARKRDAWKREHASMGHTQEYLDLLREFSNEMKKESDQFHKDLTEASRKLHAAANARRRTGASSSSVSSRSSSSMSVDTEQLAKCEAIEDPAKKRVCIRAVRNRVQFRFGAGKTYGS